VTAWQPQGIATTILASIVFPLPKSCEATWEGQRHLMTHAKCGRCGWAWHGGGKRRHYYTLPITQKLRWVQSA